MLHKVVFTLLALCATGSSRSSDPLIIGSFNAQVFGKSKINKDHIADIIVKIVKRYDLILIQEIRDIDEVAFPQLVNKVNKSLRRKRYDSIIGPRLGRGRTKEQYGFIYRTDRLETVESYLYRDIEDIFEREPYVVLFRRVSRTGRQRSFNFIPLHAKPDDAVSEMNGLVTVYKDAKRRTGITDAVIAGDLNADCNYVCRTCWKGLNLRSDERFFWLIADDVDSTTGKTDCAYDRIIVTGSLYSNSYGAAVFRFDEEYGLTMAEAKKVSDHYPVEFYIL